MLAARRTTDLDGLVAAHGLPESPDATVWLPDDLLDDDEREALGQIATPRVGLDGELYWPVEEFHGVRRD